MHRTWIRDPWSRNIKINFKWFKNQRGIYLKKERKIFLYKNNIEISLDLVDNLGYFIELEILNHENIDKTIKQINEFIEKFSITESMRNYEGYSYLLFNEKNWIII